MNRVAGIASYGIPYPVFAFSGLLVWSLFSSGLLRSAESLVSSAQLVSKVYFPRLTLPLAAACSYLIDFLVGCVFLAEGIQKFLFSESLGVGRFIKIGIPAPEIARSSFRLRL